MALRPIDNALLITPKTPKKQAKVSVPIQKKPSEFGVNDENKAPLLPSADASVDYIPSENLKPFQDPESNIQVIPIFSILKVNPVAILWFWFFFFFCINLFEIFRA